MFFRFGGSQPSPPAITLHLGRDPMWAPGVSLLLPAFIHPLPGLLQQLVNVIVNVKIKEMHATFMSFSLVVFPLSLLDLCPPVPTHPVVAVLLLPPWWWKCFVSRSLVSWVTPALSAFCALLFYSPFFLPSGLFSPSFSCLDMVYGPKTSPSQLPDAVFSGPLNWDDSLGTKG